MNALPLVQGPQAVEDGAPVVVSVASSEEEWNRFIETRADATVDHLWGWRHVIQEALGHDSRYLVARRGPSVVGVLPLVLVRSRIFGRSVVSLPFLNHGGILASDPDAVVPLIDAAREMAIDLRASHVELRHNARQCPSIPHRQHKVSMTLELPSTADALWAQLDRKVRNQVRKAQKAGLEVEAGGEELVSEFYTVFARNMRDLGTPVYPKRLFSATLRVFADRARVFIVRKEGQPVAAGIRVGFRSMVLNPWASSLRQYRQLCPNMLLYWAMLEDAIKTGAVVFDFGRSSPGGGTHQFKQQWGAVERAQFWEYVLISRSEPPDQGPSNHKFDLAIRLWQRLPLPVANFVGPAIARNLP